MPSRWRIASLALAAGIGASTLAAPDPSAELKVGVVAFQSKRYGEAAKLLASPSPLLADYAAWYRAQALYAQQDYIGAAKAAEPVWTLTPKSPLNARAWTLAAEADESAGRAPAAVELLRKNYDALPQPSGDLALANAFREAGDGVSAAMYLQRVYFNYPLSQEAAKADTELTALRGTLASNYPAEMPAARLARATKLLEGGKTQQARKEFVTLSTELAGAERDTARVRVGAADYESKTNVAASTAAALKHLQALQVMSPESDAERLYYIVACHLRTDNEEQALAAMDRLARLYPTSTWRLKALLAVANRYLVTNRIDAYEPFYRTCYEVFPKSADAAVCHWKVVWGHYIRRRDDAVSLLQAQLRMFPQSETASAALYFLGRKAEEADDPGAAHAYYLEAMSSFGNEYYGMLSRGKLGGVLKAAPSDDANRYLQSVALPKRLRTRTFTPNAAAKVRIDRADALDAAGLRDLALAELRFAGQVEDQPHVIALKLGAMEGKPELGIREVKHFVGGYLFLVLDANPIELWKTAFPLPYRTDLERFAKKNELDPYLVAGLIRQESEFDAKIVSPKDARGLMQVRPATGLEQSQKLKLPSFNAASLYQPAMNLQLGTHMFRAMIDRYEGNVEAALAAYNAGPTRATAWLTWAQYREPAEFVETVPFAQTRGYIQSVLRNADLYRRIWAR